MPYKWDLNIYRGCSHKCIYCYALYSHKYIKSNEDNNDFFRDIYVKSNIVEELEKQLNKPSWKSEIINIGGVTDSYQKLESELEMMPRILETLIKQKNPAIISTKSDLILRDIDLINELSEITYINIAGSITTLDESLRKIIEPNAKPSKNRVEMLKKIKSNTNASVGFHMMPIIPHITDSYENLEKLFKNAKIANVDYILPGTLNLYGKTRRFFFNFTANNFKDDYKNIRSIYTKHNPNKDYLQGFYKNISKLKSKYGVSSNYNRVIIEKIGKDIRKTDSNQKQDNSTQSTLFDY